MKKNWKEKKRLAKEARDAKRVENTNILDDLEVEYESHDEGRQLNLTQYKIQFSPSTERWFDKWGKERFGIKGLIEYMKKEDNNG